MIEKLSLVSKWVLGSCQRQSSDSRATYVGVCLEVDAPCVSDYAFLSRAAYEIG